MVVFVLAVFMSGQESGEAGRTLKDEDRLSFLSLGPKPEEQAITDKTIMSLRVRA